MRLGEDFFTGTVTLTQLSQSMEKCQYFDT